MTPAALPEVTIVVTTTKGSVDASVGGSRLFASAGERAVSELFSDRELGPVPRDHETIRPPVWGAIYALVEQRLATDAFASVFPDQCADGNGIAGTNHHLLGLTVVGRIPTLAAATPIGSPRGGSTESAGWPLRPDLLPEIAAILDLVEVCWEYIAEPIPLDWHSYLRHTHLNFDQPLGRARWAGDVNGLFARNGVAFEVGSDGKVRRTGTPVVADVVRTARFDTGDAILDELLEAARASYLSPKDGDRVLALQPLWDAFERTKTLRDGDKRVGTRLLAGEAAGETVTLEALETELLALTRIGNSSQIRHFETGKTKVASTEAEYLFHRCFSLLALLLGLNPA